MSLDPEIPTLQDVSNRMFYRLSNEDSIDSLTYYLLYKLTKAHPDETNKLVKEWQDHDIHIELEWLLCEKKKEPEEDKQQ